MPATAKTKLSYVPVLALGFSVLTCICSFIYANGTKDAGLKADVEHLKQQQTVVKADHDIIVETKTRVDDINRKVDRIEGKLDEMSK